MDKDSLEVDSEIILKKIDLSVAPQIFSIIDRDRNYLKKWLPFVNQTWKTSDTELFIKSLTHGAEADRNQVFTIWYKNVLSGLISFKDIDFTNQRTEIG